MAAISIIAMCIGAAIAYGILHDLVTAHLCVEYIGHVAAENGLVHLLEPMASRVPTDKHVAFIANLWAHSASYLVGLIGGIVIIVRVRRARRRDADPA